MPTAVRLPAYSMFRAARQCLLVLAAGFVAMNAAAASVRDQEIAECRVGEVATWNDGRDRPAVSSPLVFAYRHGGGPLWFSEELVAGLVAKAVEAWSPCGVPTRLVPWKAGGDLRTGTGPVVVQWSELHSGGNFGLANLDRRTLSLGPQAFRLLRERNPAYDATQIRQMVIAHEMGHFFGLMAHSRRCVDVLSYYHDGKGQTCYKRNPGDAGGVVEYRHILPTACDIERCRQVNSGAGSLVWPGN
jgi:hypothetical protein